MLEVMVPVKNGGSDGEEPACNAGDLGLIPVSGRSPGEGNSYALQYSGLENSTDCIVHGVAKSCTTEQLSPSLSLFKVIMHAVCAKSFQSCPTLCNPMDYTVHEILQAKILSGWPFPSPGDLPNPGIEPRSPSLQADLPSEPQEKPKNTRVGSLSLLQQIFPTQEWNQGLLHCRWILYQMSYKGSNIRFY